MKNVVIIGQSPAAFAAVKAILDRDPSVAVTLISCDGQLPYDRMLLPGLVDRSVKEKDLFCADEDFYKSAKIQLIQGKEISRINFTRKRVFMADKIQADFDGLIITDGPDPRLPQIKGVRRQGVFHLARLETVRSLVRYLPFTETAVVEPVGFCGIKAALALKAVGKDVAVVLRQETLLPDILAPQRGQVLAQALLKRGVRVISGGIEDIIGEAEVKAVRLKSGKVVACDMAVFEDVAVDLRYLSETELESAERITVSGSFRTQVAGVYALDAVCQMESPRFAGGYWNDTDIGRVQASVAVAGLWGEDTAPTATDGVPRDILDQLFHPEELLLPVTEVPV